MLNLFEYNKVKPKLKNRVFCVGCANNRGINITGKNVVIGKCSVCSKNNKVLIYER